MGGPSMAEMKAQPWDQKEKGCIRSGGERYKRQDGDDDDCFHVRFCSPLYLLISLLKGKVSTIDFLQYKTPITNQLLVCIIARNV